VLALNDFLVILVMQHKHHRGSRHHKHPFAKKITHDSFPRGGYLLVHYPYAKNIYSSNNNLIDERSTSQEEMDNNLIDVLTSDLRASPQVLSVGGYRHSNKSKRNADKLPLEHCCTDENGDTCDHYFCH